ncbi:MAG: gliding motility-associated ABC transporter permease subunit GldF [Prevotellaceae bacterium]|jgi:ABC-2 type transport system permease protein|nr:gliding motility-associated ABC transporter permease subunit GldF [Prevotellaceae bacterium]
MFPILKKEIILFFSSLTGYISVVIFLFLTAWFMWISHGELNIIDSGYANIDTLFIIAPWIFLFLVPATTMRSFAEEKKMGTIEILFTKPISELNLIIAKFLAAVVLVFLSLLPCLLYFITVYQLGNPVGNIDVGGAWGSFIGLFFLASCYASIGIFASAQSDNQIFAFILSAVICFFMYTGIAELSSIKIFSFADSLLLSLSINEHYQSISRGVVDSRDILYFISVIAIFILLTRLKLQSRKW